MSASTLRDIGLLEVSQLMREVDKVFNSSETVSRIIGYFNETEFYEALVINEGKLGIVTLRDLLDIVQPQKTRLSRLWKPVPPIPSEGNVSAAVGILFQSDTRAIPVIAGNRVVGLLSQTEIARALSDAVELSDIFVSKVMKHPVITIDAERKISAAREMMLEKKISHIPVLSAGKVLGVATARDIVNNFIVPMEKTEPGERIGELYGRMDSPVSGIVDANPFTVGPESSCKEVSRGFVNTGKSACVVMGIGGELLGILTPREIVSILRGISGEGEQLPITIVGLTDKDGFFESSLAEEKLRRVIEKNRRFYPQIQEVAVRLERTNLGGERTRYELTAHVRSPVRQIHTDAKGWDLLKVFDELCDNLDREMRKSKSDPMQRRSRRKQQAP